MTLSKKAFSIEKRLSCTVLYSSPVSCPVYQWVKVTWRDTERFLVIRQCTSHISKLFNVRIPVDNSHELRNTIEKKFSIGTLVRLPYTLLLFHLCLFHPCMETGIQGKKIEWKTCISIKMHLHCRSGQSKR